MVKSRSSCAPAMLPALVFVLLMASGVARGQQTGREAFSRTGTGSAPAATSQSNREVAGTESPSTAHPSGAASAAAESSAHAAAVGSETRSGSASSAATPPGITCGKTVKAAVVAIPQSFMLNRLGAAMPQGLIFALGSDVELSANPPRLKSYKRARPLVLRVNEGDCLQITFSNLIPALPSSPTPAWSPNNSLHVQGMQMVTSVNDGGTFVGVNTSALKPPGAGLPPMVYTLYAEKVGTYLLYTLGDTSTNGGQLQQGLFGAVHVEPKGAEWYRSQVTSEDLQLAIDKSKGNHGFTRLDQPILNYDAKYLSGPRAGQPILRMTDGDRIVHSDLTAIITGANHGRFAGIKGPNQPDPPCNDPTVRVDPSFCTNPALPDRKQPFREITTIYHLMPTAVQAFPIYKQQPTADRAGGDTVAVGGDNFGINYGTGGIGSEIYANRIGVGPMGGCTDCKFEEFFLSSWAVGDPAMLVDRPANAGCTTNDLQKGIDCGVHGKRIPATGSPFTIEPVPEPVRAKVAKFPDDPSNVYHSYLGDHVIFRILHGGTDVTHVHHQHAQQWLQSPNSDNTSYLDSQMISPGASYTLEMVYNGSGNLNKTIGDSIFHCHFYPHFASGMWSMWRVHDVFEAGTPTCASGQPTGCSNLPDGTPVPGSRALPDGEIAHGTPIPALVPMPTLPMAISPSPVFIEDGQVVYGKLANPDPTGINVKANPGYPFLIPGIAGKRAPHPPLDFAQENGQFLDGGLPRHVNTGGTLSKQVQSTTDWSKDFATLTSVQLPEDGTHVEKVAMGYFGKRCQNSFLSSGAPATCLGNKGGFILNGLPRKTAANPLGAQSGAPFADPAMDINGNPMGQPRVYKAAAFQLNVVFNKFGWHYPQQRMLSLWEDVAPTMRYVFGNPNSGRQPEPLFMRANSKKDFVEYWHTNLVPNYYERDDFQVRTPTDIIGQHIHLVKFDVTSSDGAANGFNYEDGTLSPNEVRELIKAIKAPGGKWTPCAGGVCPPLRDPQPPPAEICSGTNPPPQCTSEWLGAQTTIQRWYVDPLLNDNAVDRTMRTVFTHDHFGPSTHQQIGLYAGLLSEPEDAKWRDPVTGATMGGANVPPVRPDGGPTSWNVDIITGTNQANSYREFALEFQDFQLAYSSASVCDPKYPNTGYLSTCKPSSNPSKGFSDLPNAVNPANLTSTSTPFLISGAGGNSTGTAGPGTLSLNYLNAQVIQRIGQTPDSDLSNAFNSTYLASSPIALPGDPITPLMRAYVNDKVQVRVLVGAHMLSHFFNIYGIKWFAEAGTPTDPKAVNNSGYRASQGMGLSEHFELLFKVPPSSITGSKGKCPDNYSPNAGACADYLYSPSFDDTGLAEGIWGIFRSYDPLMPFSKLTALPKTSNPITGLSTVPKYAACPPTAPKRTFMITAVTAQKALQPPNTQVAGTLVYNSRGAGTGTDPQNSALRDPYGILYVRSEDVDENGILKPNVPVEPLILRASAGDCIRVTLKNGLDPSSAVFSAANQSKINTAVAVPPVFTPSKLVGLSPQLLAYDAAASEGVNVGYNKLQDNNRDQTAAFGSSPVNYTWYAGDIGMNSVGKLVYTPIEFGSLNLFSADLFLQHTDGLFGSMIVEPAGATWKCDGKTGLIPCDAPATPGNIAFQYPTTRAAATVTVPGPTTFREFVQMISDDVRVYYLNNNQPAPNTTSAVNYRTEPTSYRYGNLSNLNSFAASGNNACATSNLLVKTSSQSLLQADPQTPVFSAKVGDHVRFRLMHPPGTGTSQVFTLSGHVWQRNPYANFSKQIGDNWQSQWIGSRDSHGASDHFDLIVSKAGGKFRIPGDYLYTVFLPNQNSLGAWGIFRVLDANGKVVLGNPTCPPTTGGGAASTALPKSKEVAPFLRSPQPPPAGVNRTSPRN